MRRRTRRATIALVASLASVARAQTGAAAIAFSRCETTTPAPEASRLNFTSVVGYFDQGQTTAGVAGPGLQAGTGTLHLVAFGTAASQSEGYSPSTNFLGASQSLSAS